jgi:hypothetical protein
MASLLQKNYSARDCEAEKMLSCRTVLLRNKQERFYNTELLCAEMEENDILV